MKLTYDELLPVLFHRLAYEVEFPVLCDFISAEFGIDIEYSSLESEPETYFEISEQAFREVFSDISYEDLGALLTSITEGFSAIQSRKEQHDC